MNDKNNVRKLIGELEKLVEINKFSKSHEIIVEIIKTNDFYAIEYANYLVSKLY